MTRASDLAKLLGAGATINDGTTISTADNDPQLILKCTDTDASTGPKLDLERNPGEAGADGDNLAQINFYGYNDASEKTQYLYLFAEAADVANGSEDVRFGFGGLVAGADSSLMTFMHGTSATGADPEMVFNDSSKDINFRVESNGNANMLFVNGGDNTVSVGHNSTGGANLAVCDGANSAIQFFAEVATDTNLIQHYDQTATAYMNAQYSGATHQFFIGTGEAMRIDTNNFLLIGTTIAKGMLNILRNTNSTADPTVFLAGDGTTNVHISFGNSSGTVLGTIRSNSGGIQYNTSSDYRLKENVITDWDATTRLKQLKPSRFNFIADADTTVDGFLAHEVSSIVPEAISGEKDATEDIVNVVLNADGTVNSNGVSESDWTAGKSDETYASDTTWVASKTVPSYQGIDQSKLVPLLVKTIQELEARITALESA